MMDYPDPWEIHTMTGAPSEEECRRDMYEDKDREPLYLALGSYPPLNIEQLYGGATRQGKATFSGYLYLGAIDCGHVTHIMYAREGIYMEFDDDDYAFDDMGLAIKGAGLYHKFIYRRGPGNRLVLPFKPMMGFNGGKRRRVFVRE